MRFEVSILFVSIILSTDSVIIPDSSLNLSEVVWQYEASEIYLGSPSLLRLDNNTILESNVHFGTGFKNQQRNISLHISTNNGLDWKFSSWCTSQYWSNLFALNNDLYLLGTNDDGNSASIKISQSSDKGKTWIGKILFPYNTKSGIGYNTGPTPSLIVNNKTLYRALEAFVPPYKWGVDYQAVLIYVDIDTDLMNVSNWKITKSLAFDPNWIASNYPKGVSSTGYLEGNAVLKQSDGIVRNVLRFDGVDNSNQHHILNHAVILRLNETSNVLEFEKFIYLPGGHTKFVIHYDYVSKKYISLTNNATCVGSSSNYCSDPRNVLTLISSNDLENWNINLLLLHDDTGFNAETSRQYTGFHYVDWHFDNSNNEDIIYMIRTAYRGANTYHNSNRITFKILYNFRKYL